MSDVLSKDDKIAADNIQRLRQDHDPPLSLRRLEQLTGISYGTINGFLSKTHRPRFSDVCAIADALGVSLDDLRRPAKPSRRRASA